MSTGRTAAVAVVALLLTASVAGANVVVAGQRTVLDAGYVTDTLEDEGAYADLEDAVRDQLSDGLDEGGPVEGELGPVADALDIGNGSALVDDAVDRAYLQSQVERNVEAAYAYLHGDDATLNLSVDLEPVKTGVSEALGDRVRNASVAELVGAANVSQDLTVVPVNESVVAGLGANASSYQATREEFRTAVRDRVLDRLADQAFQDASNDDLLALVIPDYDPEEYSESEKEQMVSDRETEIRTALRERIESERGDEVDAAVQDELAAVHDRAESRSDELVPDDVPSDLATPVADLALAVVGGLTTDQSYDEYVASTDAAKADLAAGVETYVGDALDGEIEDRRSLSDDLDADTRDTLRQAANYVQLGDQLALLLPLVAAAAVGLLYLATRSLVATARTAGGSLLTVGVLGAVGATLAADQIPGLVPPTPDDASQAQETVREVMLALVDGLFDTVVAQSVLLVLLGAVLAGLAWAAARGHLEEARRRVAER